MQSVNQEEIEMVKELQKISVQTDLDDLKSLSQAIKDGILERQVFFQALAHMHSKYGIREERYLHLLEYIQYIQKQQTIDAAQLLEEIMRLTSVLRFKLAENPNARHINSSVEMMELVCKAIGMKMTSYEYERYQNIRPYLDWMVSFVAELAIQFGFAFDHSEFRALISASEVSVQFYEHVVNRSMSIVENVLATMGKMNRDRVILITEGFLYPYVNQQLVAQGVNVSKVVPYVKVEIDQKRYEEIVLRRLKL